MLINDDNHHRTDISGVSTAGIHAQLGTHIKREQEELGGAIEIWKSSERDY